jgi:hypothetical protein
MKFKTSGESKSSNPTSQNQLVRQELYFIYNRCLAYIAIQREILNWLFRGTKFSLLQYICLTLLFPFGSFRHTETNPNTKEVNFKKVVPAFPNENLIETRQVDSYTGQDLSSGEPIKSSRQKNINNLVTQGISSDVPKQLSKKKNYRYCCFMH